MKITLTQNAYVCSNGFDLVDDNGHDTGMTICGDYYTALAEDSNDNTYRVYWTINDNFDINEDCDESDACDWDNPIMILSASGRNVVDQVAAIV